MSVELTNYMPDLVARDFRALLLGELTGETEWRSRRVDRYESVDWDSFSQTTSIDTRLRRQDVRRVLEDLEARYRRRAWEPVADQIRAMLEDPALRPPGCQSPWTHVSIVMPIVWVPGPLVDFSVVFEGRELAPLSRRDAAALYRPVVARLLRLARELRFAPADEAGVSDELAWMLVAIDAQALSAHPRLTHLEPPLDSPSSMKAVERWCADDLVRAGHEPGAVAMTLERHRNRLLNIAVKAESNRLRLAANGVRDFSVHCAAPAQTACMNPLLFHHSFMKLMQSRVEANGDEALTLNQTVMRFIRVAEYWVDLVSDLVDSIARAREAEPSAANAQDAEFASELVRALFFIGDNWPIVVRVSIPVEENCRFRVRQTIFSPTLGRTRARVSGTRRNPFRFVAGILRMPASKLWGLLANAVDGLWILAGFRGPLRCQRSSQAYPLVMHDARSTHVEVVCERSEIHLVPRSAFVKIPEIYAPNTLLRAILKWPFLASLAPHRKIGAPEVFGRVSDEGSRIQHFYTTKTRQECPWERQRAGAGPESQTPGIPHLVVRYRIPWHIGLTNLLALLVAAVLSLLMLRTSLVDAAGLAGQALPQGAGGIDFVSLLTVSLPVFLGVLLLFAFEKHSDLLVAEVLGRYSWLVVGSFVLALCSAALRAMATAAPGLPNMADSRIAVWWRGVGCWFVQNEPVVYHSAWLALRVVVAAAVLPLAAWLVLLICGNTIDAVRASRARRRRPEKE